VGNCGGTSVCDMMMFWEEGAGASGENQNRQRGHSVRVCVVCCGVGVGAHLALCGIYIDTEYIERYF
jgi:hypothetical protein